MKRSALFSSSQLDAIANGPGERRLPTLLAAAKGDAKVQPGPERAIQLRRVKSDKLDAHHASFRPVTSSG